jgi:hypothetical protein
MAQTRLVTSSALSPSVGGNSTLIAFVSSAVASAMT